MTSNRAQAIRWRIARRHLNQQHSHRLWWALALFLAIVLSISGAGAAGAWYWTAHLPPASSFHIRYAFQDARFYDVRGDLLYNMADLGPKGGRRIVVPLQGLHDQGDPCRGGVDRIPLVLQDATIATEDATFYKNPGFDPWSIVRAAYQNFKYGHIVSGASTITQQVVRNTMLNDERTLNRKAEEVALAYEISRTYSKRRILWYYLNSVPYGNLAIGAQAAAQTYFHVPVCRLDLAQAALLAGLPRAPTLYNPVSHRAAALARMHTVLQLMRKHGYLRYRWQVNRATREAQGWRFAPLSATLLYPAFTRYAVDQIKQMPGLASMLYRGIDVYTTLDPRLQSLAQVTVSQQIAGLALQHVTDGALVSLDLRPGHYGWIDAMVGSASLRGKASQINMATSPRQPGSSMKPFNYIYAFVHGGVGPGTTVDDSAVALPDPNDTLHGGWYEPQNYDHQWHGTVTLRQALANSLNVPAVKLEYYITHPQNVARTAAQFGMTSLYRDNPGLDCSVCYAVTLGGLTRGTRLLEETSAYGVFATGGFTVPPVAIWKVVQRRTGKVLYCSQSCPRGVKPDPRLAAQRQRVLDAAHAFEMTDVLSDDNARCTPQVCEFGYHSALELSRQAAAKTGTTNDFTDNWTVGYVPQMVTGVWAGNADRSPMIDVIGVTGAAPIWHNYMEGAFKVLKLPVQTYQPPPNVEVTTACTGGAVRNAQRGFPSTPTTQPGVPYSTAMRTGASDVFVPAGNTVAPLCSLPDKGYLPVPCNQYPSTILPLGWQCPSGAFSGSYTYTYTLGPNGTYQYTYHYSNGTTRTSPFPPGFGGQSAQPPGR